MPDNGNVWRKYRVVPRAYPSHPLVCAYFHRDGNKERFRLPGAGGERFHCTVDPSPGHIRCRKFVAKMHANLVFHGCISFLRCFRRENSRRCWQFPISFYRRDLVVDQEPKRTHKAKKSHEQHQTHSSEQLEGVTCQYPVKQGF